MTTIICHLMMMLLLSFHNLIKWFFSWFHRTRFLVKLLCILCTTINDIMRCKIRTQKIAFIDTINNWCKIIRWIVESFTRVKLSSPQHTFFFHQTTVDMIKKLIGWISSSSTKLLVLTRTKHTIYNNVCIVDVDAKK